MSERRLFVRQDERGFWVFGRKDQPFEAFPSREDAVRAALKFVMKHPEVELIVEDGGRRRRRARVTASRNEEVAIFVESSAKSRSPS